MLKETFYLLWDDLNPELLACFREGIRRTF
jgi:hypothetical protein